MWRKYCTVVELLQVLHQLADAVRQAHEVLCSLKLDDTMTIFALVQYELVAKPYLSFSIRDVTAKNESYCRNILLIRMKTCSRSDLEGCLRLLSFIAQVEKYRSGNLRTKVLETLELS